MLLDSASTLVIFHCHTPTSTASVGCVQVAEPSPGIQLAASVLGLLALPIVGWSEYQLKTTGK